jgi:hypothetical protein
MKDSDINKCVKSTPAPDWFRKAMAKGEVPIFGKKKSHLSKLKAKKRAA